MRDKLIEGRLLTVIVGNVFRAVEVAVRGIQLALHGLGRLIQKVIAAPIDAVLSRFGKRAMARRIRVDGSSIVFIERDGEYTGDLKYIAEEVLRRGGPYRITWVLRDQSIGPFPSAFGFVRHGTAAYFRALAGAKVVVQNDQSLLTSGIDKKPGQHWVQTEDGCCAGKPPERADAQVLSLGPGGARTDPLMDGSNADAVRAQVLDRLGIVDAGQRFLLYAAPGMTDFRALRAALGDAFGGTWEILLRPPSRDAAQADLLAGLPAYCRDASRYPDRQELLVVADACVAPPSDLIADYLLTRKPAFLVSAGGHRPCPQLESAEFSVATSNRELLAAITQFDTELHDRKVSQFVALRGNVDDGRAAARAVDTLESLMAP